MKNEKKKRPLTELTGLSIAEVWTGLLNLEAMGILEIARDKQGKVIMCNGNISIRLTETYLASIQGNGL